MSKTPIERMLDEVQWAPVEIVIDDKLIGHDATFVLPEPTPAMRAVYGAMAREMATDVPYLTGLTKLHPVDHP